MSAFIVSTDHIDALLTAAEVLARPYAPFRWYWNGKRRDLANYRLDMLAPYDPDHDHMSDVGRMLIAENVRSVGYRYDSKTTDDLDDLPGPNDKTGLRGDYVFRALPGYPDPIVTLKALACYEYQACETPGWEDSEAFAFCQALRSTCINKLPGYEDAPWCINDRHVFSAPRAA